MGAADRFYSQKLAAERGALGQLPSVEIGTYGAIVKGPQVLAEFLQDCVDGFARHGVEGEHAFSFLQRRVTAQGRPLSSSALCVALEDVSSDWFDDEPDCQQLAQLGQLAAVMERFASMQGSYDSRMDFRGFVQPLLRYQGEIESAADGLNERVRVAL